jgi:hypothetical protein
VVNSGDAIVLSVDNPKLSNPETWWGGVAP